MKREEAISKLVEIQKYKDIETAHCEADEVLLELLETLGYQDVVEEFLKIEKWYA